MLSQWEKDPDLNRPCETIYAYILPVTLEGFLLIFSRDPVDQSPFILP